jgi:hypothetical protein
MRCGDQVWEAGCSVLRMKWYDTYILEHNGYFSDNCSECPNLAGGDDQLEGWQGRVEWAQGYVNNLEDTYQSHLIMYKV